MTGQGYAGRAVPRESSDLFGSCPRDADRGDTEQVKSKLIVLVLALLMVGCFATAAFAIVKVSDKDDKATHGHKHDKHDKHGDKARGHGKGHQDDGLGPYS